MRISYTQISTYQRCPQQYKLAHVDRIPVVPAPVLVLGGAVHEALRCLHDPGRLRPPALEEVVEQFCAAWQRQEAQLPEAERQAYFEEGVELLRRYYELNAQPEKDRFTAAAELNFTLPFEDGHTLTGRIDRLDVLPGGGLEVIDYKTGRRMPTQPQVDKNLQLAIYLLAAQHLYPGRPTRATFYYLFHNFRLTTEPKPEALEARKWEIREVLAGVEAQAFDPRLGPHCDWCDWRSYCLLFRAPQLPEGAQVAADELVKEYGELSSQAKQLEQRLEQLKASLHDYFERSGTLRHQAGGYAVVRAKRVSWEYDPAQLKAVLEPLGLWEQVVEPRAAAVKELLGKRALSPEAAKQVTEAARAREYYSLVLKPVAESQEGDTEA